MACRECKDVASCYQCLLDTIVSPAKTAKQMEMRFGLCTQVGRRNHLLGGGPDPHTGKGILGSCFPQFICIVSAIYIYIYIRTTTYNTGVVR